MDKALKNFAVSVLRSASIRWKEKSEAIKDARIERGLYRCKMCEGAFKKHEIQADHREPVIDPHIGWQGFDSFIERLFVTKDKYDILCKTCHTAKTLVEDEIRKAKTKERNEEKKIQAKEERKRQKELDKQKKKE